MKKINNSGFSLIELIIVIAIMAVLVAVIAPNLTKYLGKAKVNADIKNLDEVHGIIMNCLSEAYLSDPQIQALDNYSLLSATYVFQYNDTKEEMEYDSSDSRNANGDSAFANLIVSHIKNFKLVSKTGTGDKLIITIDVNSADGYDVSQKFDN